LDVELSLGVHDAVAEEGFLAKASIALRTAGRLREKRRSEKNTDEGPADRGAERVSVRSVRSVRRRPAAAASIDLDEVHFAPGLFT